MKSYQFTSANDIDVTVMVDGSYHDCYDKDLFVTAGNGFETEITECGDGEDVIEALEAAGIEFSPNARHFVAYVITACMIVGDDTLEGALDYQARWEAQK